jgi:hypothetical protein
LVFNASALLSRADFNVLCDDVDDMLGLEFVLDCGAKDSDVGGVEDADVAMLGFLTGARSVVVREAGEGEEAETDWRARPLDGVTPLDGRLGAAFEPPTLDGRDFAAGAVGFGLVTALGG